MTFVAVDQNRERLTELTRLLLEAFPGSVIYQHTNPLKAPKDVRNNRVDAVFAQLDMGNLGGAELLRESLSGVLRDGVPGLRKACVWGAFSISSG